jgi:hypothetical protein
VEPSPPHARAAIVTAPLAKMDTTIMKTIFQFGLPRQIAGLLLLLHWLAVSDGRAADSVAVPPEGSAGEAIISHLTGAQSELIVPGPHGSFGLPQTVSELKRILRLNLAAGGTPRRNTMPKSERSAAGSSSERPERSETPASRTAGENNSRKPGVPVAYR